MEYKLLTEHYDKENYKNLEGYLQYGGYETLKLALGKQPKELVEMVKESGLRGRGGAGFPTGVKWSFLPDNKEPRYLLCNADEGEPGTFKDRMMMEKAPHQLIEGMIISAFAIQSHKSYIYIRGEYTDCIAIIEQALKEAKTQGYLGKNILNSGFDHEMDIYVGAGAYICGEETGMISSLEGKKGQPKLKPPYPAVKGYLGKPTVVNNVETLSAVVPIVRNGPEKYKTIGTKHSAGTKIFSVSGNVLKPGNYEVPLGYPLMDMIKLCGGLPPGRTLKACIPGGSSAPVLTAEECQKACLDYENLVDLGSMLGSGAVIVIDDSNSMVDLLSVIMNFYHHESCGQCTPCREGTGWLDQIVKNILNGKGRFQDIDLIQKISQNMMGKTICALSDAAALPAISFVTKFKEEFINHIQQKPLSSSSSGTLLPSSSHLPRHSSSSARHSSSSARHSSSSSRHSSSSARHSSSSSRHSSSSSRHSSSSSRHSSSSSRHSSSSSRHSSSSSRHSCESRNPVEKNHPLPYGPAVSTGALPLHSNKKTPSLREQG